MAEYIYYADKYLKTFNPDYVIMQVTESDFFSDAKNSNKSLYIKNDDNSIEVIENKDIVINKTKLFKDKYLNFSIITYLYNVKINELKNLLLHSNQNKQISEHRLMVKNQ